MPKMSSVADKVKKIVVEQLGVSEDQVTPEAKFIEDLGADSLDQVENSARIFRTKTRKS